MNVELSEHLLLTGYLLLPPTSLPAHPHISTTTDIAALPVKDPKFSTINYQWWHLLLFYVLIMMVFSPEEEIEVTCSSIALSLGCSSLLEQKISLLIFVARNDFTILPTWLWKDSLLCCYVVIQNERFPFISTTSTRTDKMPFLIVV